MVFLKDRLAKYEYSVADYYTDRGAWVAVVNRVEGMMRNYPDTQATRDGLKLMENAYRQMQMNGSGGQSREDYRREQQEHLSLTHRSQTAARGLPFFIRFPTS